MADRNKTNPRQVALKCLIGMEKGIFLSDAMKEADRTSLRDEDRAFVTRLVKGVTEKRIYLDHVLGIYADIPTERMDKRVLCTLRMGAYQILFMDNIPAYAAIDQSVRLVGAYRGGGFKRFVNAVLRNLERNAKSIPLPDPESEKTGYYSIVYSIPEWIVEVFTERFGEEEALRILRLSQREAPVSFWINRFNEDSYKTEGTDLKEALEKGRCYIQDASSMKAIDRMRLDLEKGREGTLKILDVCASPGGKSLYISNIMKESAEYTLRDISAPKVRRINENIDRLGRRDFMKAEIKDAAVYDPSDMEKYDIVIADVPCSGLGVLSRKPDIKYRVTRDDIEKLVSLQRKIIDVSSRYVRKEGLFIYSTCTLTEEENEGNVRYILKNHPFGLETVEGGGAYGLQILPGEKNDGFFAAKLRKNG